MAAKTQITNTSLDTPLSLPPPYRGVVAPGRGAIVTGTKAEVIANLGGANAVGTLRFTELPDDIGATHDGPLTLGSHRLTDVTDPTAAQDAATKAYVDGSSTGFASMNSPPTAATGTLVTTIAMANGALAIAAQPVTPCKLQVKVVDANSSVTAGVVTLVGVGVRGQALSQVISLVTGSLTTLTTDAFANITSATISALAGAAGADTIEIGPSTSLGLPATKTPVSTGFSVFKATKFTQVADPDTGVITVTAADEAVGTVDATAGTIIPTTVPNGATSYEFWYNYTAV